MIKDGRVGEKRVAVINGSLGGRGGNTGLVLDQVRRGIGKDARVEEIHLVEKPSKRCIAGLLRRSSGMVFATGTYWDSWGSPLQQFFEDATEWEGGAIWAGKPAAVIVTMHSAGGKQVLSRMQGVLSSLGCLIPPMSGMVYSMANHLAFKGEPSDFHADLWSLDDVGIVCHNLIEAINGKNHWKSWPFDTKDPKRLWLKPIPRTRGSLRREGEGENFQKSIR